MRVVRRPLSLPRLSACFPLSSLPHLPLGSSYSHSHLVCPDSPPPPPPPQTSLAMAGYGWVVCCATKRGKKTDKMVPKSSRAFNPVLPPPGCPHVVPQAHTRSVWAALRPFPLHLGGFRPSCRPWRGQTVGALDGAAVGCRPARPSAAPRLLPAPPPGGAERKRSCQENE